MNVLKKPWLSTDKNRARLITSMRSPWHCAEIDGFQNWLRENNYDPHDPKLSLGYLKLGDVDLISSFGTKQKETVWKILSDHLDIYKIEVDNVSVEYDYNWTDIDHEIKQMKQLGYV